MKFGTTRPSRRRIRGPYVLKMRTMRVSTPVIAVIRHRHRFGEALRLVVHAARADRVHVAPVGLLLRVHQRIAVHLADVDARKKRAPFAFASPSALCVPSAPTLSVGIGSSR